MNETPPSKQNSTNPAHHRPGSLARPGPTGYVLLRTGHIPSHTDPDPAVTLYERVLRGLKEL